MIRSHSLHQTNIVFLFKENILPPENKELVSVFEGETAEGINFLDNPAMQTKLLNVPKLALTVIWEGKRLRIEDQAQREPQESLLIDEALKIYNKVLLSKNIFLTGVGFNFNLYYQFTDVIRMQDFFSAIYHNGLSTSDSLMDFGWQWTIASKDMKALDGYFVKITAPLELAVHHNSHFNLKSLPPPDQLKKLFSESYQKTHQTIRDLALG